MNEPVAVAPERADEIDKALGLKLISIRLPADLIDDYKMLAELQGVIYQPLMRDALRSWAEAEKSRVLKGLTFDRRERQKRRAAQTENIALHGQQEKP